VAATAEFTVNRDGQSQALASIQDFVTGLNDFYEKRRRFTLTSYHAAGSRAVRLLRSHSRVKNLYSVKAGDFAVSQPVWTRKLTDAQTS